jgi:hypothetical protein
LHKKDPEGRNTIALCLAFASNKVLEEIIETFENYYDIKASILKTEFDFNPSFNIALSLSAFNASKDRSL